MLPVWIAYPCLSIGKNPSMEESNNWLLTFEDPPFKDSEIFPLEMRSNSQFVVQTSTWTQLWNDDPSVWRSSNTLGKLSSDSSLLTNPSASKGTKQNMTIWGKRAVYHMRERLKKWKSKMAFGVRRRTTPLNGTNFQSFFTQLFFFCNWILHIWNGFCTWSQSKISLSTPLIISSKFTFFGSSGCWLPTI